MMPSLATKTGHATALPKRQIRGFSRRSGVHRPGCRHWKRASRRPHRKRGAGELTAASVRLALRRRRILTDGACAPIAVADHWR
jgi:hypothetical protein